MTQSVEGLFLKSFGHEEKGNEKVFLLILVVVAFLLRIPLFLSPEVIHNDGAEYIRHAKLILTGDWTAGKAPPLYPALIAFAHLFIPDPERAGILISILFGTLLVLPVFYLGKEIFNRQAGVFSSLIVVFHPYLNSYSGSVLTESTYYFLVAAIVLAGWFAFRHGRFRETVLFGFLTSLAYLTRPEGVGFLIVFCFWVLLVNPPDGKRRWVRRFGIALSVLICFLILSGPYLVHIHKETGRWGITKKFSITMESALNEEGAQSIEAFTQRKEIYLLTLAKNPQIVLKKIGIGFFQSLYKFQQAFHPLLFFFALLTLVFWKRDSVSLKANLYLFAYFFFFLGLVLPFLWVARRYTSQMIPIAIPWAGFGFLQVMRWISGRFKRGVVKRWAPILLAAVILIGLFIQGWPLQDRGYRLVQKEVGLWMRDHLPKGQKMMSKMGQESFYAGQAWVRLPEKPYDEILREARARGARYLVIDESIEKDSPDFLGRSKERELVPLFELRKKNRYMIVYEILDPNGKQRE